MSESGEPAGKRHCTGVVTLDTGVAGIAATIA